MTETTNAETAQAATQSAALPRRAPTLIGIFGPDNDLTALVRLPSGDIARLRPGDMLDRGTITAIAPDRVIVQTGPQTDSLRFPDVRKTG